MGVFTGKEGPSMRYGWRRVDALVSGSLDSFMGRWFWFLRTFVVVLVYLGFLSMKDFGGV